MKNLSKTILNAAAALLILPALSFAEGKSIYGEDNRLEYFAASQDMKTLSGSVVSFWKASSIEILNPGGVKLKTVNLGKLYNLCPGEKFREQPAGAFCSGSLVGPDLVMTAGHCIKNDEGCAVARIVFGYAVKAAGSEAVTMLPSSEVYTCSRILKRFHGSELGSGNPTGQALAPDYALIQLDRKVTGHKPLPINRGTSLRKGDGVTVIGHPMGLPLKVAGGATVRDFFGKSYFTADLDTFDGNSGSPVFNTRTRKIEGILVRGDEDFSESPAGCRTMATYEQTGGSGEYVTKISALSAFIPKLAREKEAALTEAGSIEVREVEAAPAQPGDTAPMGDINFD